MTPSLIFMHIPKTAGSSFNATLKEVFGSRFLQLTPHGVPWPDLAGNVENYQAFSGHIMIGHEIYQRLDRFIHVTIFRNPVERVIDAYNYLLDCEIHPLHEEALKTSWKEALLSDNPCWGLKNLATWHLSGIPEGKADEAERMKLAKETLLKFDLFGFTELYAWFIAECNQRFGWSAKVRWENFTSHHRYYNDEVRQLIAEKNLLDIELYNFAKQVIYGLVAHH